MTKHVIDAKDKKIGRIASEAAIILMGKNSTDFAKNKIADVKVEIINASKADISEKKKITRYHITYSGFPGGQKREKLGDLIQRKGTAEAFKRAVKGMLPDNKLKSKMMLNLSVTE